MSELRERRFTIENLQKVLHELKPEVEYNSAVVARSLSIDWMEAAYILSDLSRRHILKIMRYSQGMAVFVLNVEVTDEIYHDLIPAA